jgi:hypothetical protein
VTEPLPRSRGTVFLQVLVAALFLAVIGGSVGLAVGLRDREHGGTSRQGQDQPTQQEQIPQTQPETRSPSGEPSAESCPEGTGRQAGRDDLAQELYLQTAQSEVWICRDGGGGLYYQGHRYSDERWLFLTGVEQDGDEYVATNPTGEAPTVYRVSPAGLKIEYSDGRTEEQQAVGAGG